MALRSIQATCIYICTWWLALPGWRCALSRLLICISALGGFRLPFPDGAALYPGYLYLYLYLVACVCPSRMALRTIQATCIYIYIWWLALAPPGWRCALSRLLVFISAFGGLRLPFSGGAVLYPGYLYLYLHLVACPSQMALRSIQATYMYICTWWLSFALPGWRYALSRLLVFISALGDLRLPFPDGAALYPGYLYLYLHLVACLCPSRMALRSIQATCVGYDTSTG